MPPAAYFSRPGKVGKSGLRASPRDPSGARAPCGGSLLRLWTSDCYRSRARTGKTSFSFHPYRGVGSALGQEQFYGGSLLPAMPGARTKADGLVIPLLQSACLTKTNAGLPHGSSPFLWLRLRMAESGGLPRVSAGHRFRHLPEGSRGGPLVSFPPTFRNWKVGPPEAAHRTGGLQKSVSDHPQAQTKRPTAETPAVGQRFDLG